MPITASAMMIAIGPNCLGPLRLPSVTRRLYDGPRLASPLLAKMRKKPPFRRWLE
jgi:hypothetical protein